MQHACAILVLCPCQHPYCWVYGAEGGKFAAENVATYKRGRAGIDHHMTQQKQKQLAAVDALSQELSRSLHEELRFVKSLLPPHKEDMSLLEAVNRSVSREPIDVVCDCMHLHVIVLCVTVVAHT